jgi:dTMP kinase
MALFISFEGCEGSGKSTQIKLLGRHLETIGHKVLLTREPGGTIFSEQIRDLLLNGEGVHDVMNELFLVNVARRDHVENKIKPALRDGMIVISDRFSDSTIAYQGFAKGMDLNVIYQVQQLAIGNFKPDLTIVLDLDSQAGINRTTKRRNNNFYDLKSLEFHNKVRQGFLKVAADEPSRVIILDAALPIQEVQSLIVKIVNTKINN